MDGRREEWIPLRQAVVEVAKEYSNFLSCERAAALVAAHNAIIRRLQLNLMKSRSEDWSLSFIQTGNRRESNQNVINGFEIPGEFWFEFEKSDCISASDWVSGEYIFIRHRIDHYSMKIIECMGYASKVEVNRDGLPVIGDYFSNLRESDEKFDHTHKSSRKRVVDATKVRKPTLPVTKLTNWWEALDAKSRALSHVELLKLANVSFPENSISRDRIRALAPGRKPGPKPIR